MTAQDTPSSEKMNWVEYCDLLRNAQSDPQARPKERPTIRQRVPDRTALATFRDGEKAQLPN